MFIQIKNAEELLQKLGEIPGSQAAHGEVSFGYSFELKDGSKLIIGQTDTDVSEEHLFWIQLINKPVETTNEQPKKDFPCKGMYKYPGACGLEQECTCS